jgi:hypothetical protein
MQCHPDYEVVPDGLPAVRRFYNIYHPYDPVAYRLEPLAYSPSELAGHRGALVELHGGGGGKRLHIAAQELGDSMSSAASRLGSTLAGALSFGRGQKRSAGGVGVAGTAVGAGLAVVEPGQGARQGDAAVAAIDAAFSGAALGNIIPEKQQEKSLNPTGEAAMDTTDNATAEKAAAVAAEEKETETTTAQPMDLEFGHPDSSIPTTNTTSTSTTTSTISRVAGGELPTTRGWPTAAAGRIDFALQEASLESQYLAALKAHFIYWGSMDVALFIYRAVKGLDVVNGKPLDVVVVPEQEKEVETVAVAGAGTTVAVPELTKEKEVAAAVPTADIVFGEADQLAPAL